jgi:hypothetical protein
VALANVAEPRHCNGIGSQHPFQGRQLVPIDFYTWKKTATSKQPYAVALADRG